MIEWGVASITLPGQAESGDRHLVKVFPNRALVAAVDGIGHGDEAAEASRTALAGLESYAGEHLIALVTRCHRCLQQTRGVVMSVASFHAVEGIMMWLGVGNVEGVLLRLDMSLSLVRESLLLRPGVVGRQLPPLQAAVLPITRGDMLIFATDGVRNDFLQQLNRNELPQKAAERILAQHAKGTDDALVFVARYVGYPT